MTQRIELLERDRAQQSRAITELIQKVQKGFSPEQVSQIRTAFREELADAGLRLDDASHQDEAREDLRFLRRFRLRWDGAAAKIGNAVLSWWSREASLPPASGPGSARAGSRLGRAASLSSEPDPAREVVCAEGKKRRRTR